MTPTTSTPGLSGAFAVGLSELVCRVIREQRSHGIDGMSRDNLWQIIPRRVSQIPGAPQGTNAQWVARTAFDEVCDHLPPTYRRFILP